MLNPLDVLHERSGLTRNLSKMHLCLSGEPSGTLCSSKKQSQQSVVGFSCDRNKSLGGENSASSAEKWPPEGSPWSRCEEAGAAIEGEDQPGEGSARVALLPSLPAAASLSPATAFPPPTSRHSVAGPFPYRHSRVQRWRLHLQD